MGKIVFFPLLTGMGHFNIGLTISKRIFQLYGDKHEIYFLVNKGYSEKLRKINPKIKCLIYHHPFLDKEKDEDAYVLRIFNEFGESFRIKDRVEFVNHTSEAEFEFYEQNKLIYNEITELLNKLKPDFFIYDQIMTTPVGIDQGIPYAMLLSCAPTFIGYNKLPPHQSDLPTEYTPENVKLWDDFCKKTYLQGRNKELNNLLNQWLKETNSPVNLDGFYHHNAPSPYVNFYNYPNLVDYDEKLPGNWMKLESAILSPLPEPFAIPEKLAKLNNNKLVYVSVGSWSSAYKPLMERIIGILSQLPYRFILSGGILLNELNLSENIYAERYVNQLAVLQTVSCFVTHGGNNSFTEAFYIGVPQIILPLFADQINNARRITDKELGFSFHPFEFTAEQLHTAIEKLTTPEMAERYREISAKIRSDKGIDKICEKIVSYCK